MSRSTPFPLALLLAFTATAAMMVTVAISVEPSPEAARLDCYTDADGANYFALTLKPQVKLPPAAAHDIVVFLETSASQAGDFRDKALDTLRTMLKGLGPQDRVHLMAVDLNAVPMTKDFVAPNSPEMQAAIQRLEGRAPLGATDMEKALRAAVASFKAGSTNPRVMVYLGNGTSKANILSPQKFEELANLLVDAKIPVNSFSVGPQLDLQMLGALAARTGGRVIDDAPLMTPGAAKMPRTADEVGRDLAASACGVVLWPEKNAVAWPANFTVYPKLAPPLRTDRDSVVIGKYTGAGPFEIKMTVATAAGLQKLAWTVAAAPSKPTNHYLATLVQSSQATGGITLPLVDSESLKMASSETYIGARNSSELARQALNLGDLDGAEALARNALEMDPQDPVALRVLKEAAQRRASGKTSNGMMVPIAMAAQQDSLELIGPAAAPPPAAPAPGAALPPAAPPDGAFMNSIEHERKVIAQMITAEVQHTLNLAREKMATDPDMAIQELKQKLESVRRAPELDPVIRDQLCDQLQAALRAASQQQVEVNQRRRERLENLAAAKERQLVYENLMVREQKLEQLLERFNSLMLEGRYRLAEEAAAKEAQQLAPANPVTTSAAVNARTIGYYNDAMALRVARQKAVVDTLYQVEKAQIPFPDDPPIIYPDAEVWQQLTVARKERYSSVDLAQHGPAEKKINDALKSPTQLEFIETPLQDVIDFLKDFHQIEIQIDQRALDDVGIGTDTPITRNLKGITLRSALRLLLRDLDLTYVIQDEVLLITTPEEAETRLSTKVYPVADLVLPINPMAVSGMGGGMGMMGGMGGGMGGMGGGMGGMGGMGGGMGGMGGMGGGGMFNVPPNLQNIPKGGFRAWAVQDDLSLTPEGQPRPAANSEASTPIKQIQVEIEEGADPNVVWDRYFAQREESPAAVRDAVRRLMSAQKFDHVIALIQAALRHKQPQTWMYEALGLAMQAAGREPEEVERALMSSVDFAQTPLDVMCIGIYLDRSGLKKRALDLYRQVSQVSPLQPEPYIYGLKAAKAVDDIEGIQWATLGILKQAWRNDQIEIWKTGIHEAQAMLERLRQEKRTAEAKQFETALDEAVRRDCVIKVSWTGDADVDLVVEEPSGSICSFRNPRTAAGGVMLGDTVSQMGKDDAEGFSEVYVCPQGFSGTYRFVLRRVWGEVTAGKVNVEICTHYRDKNEGVVRKQLALENGEAVGKFELAGGRRKESVDQQHIANAANAQLALRQQVLGLQTLTRQALGQQVLGQQIGGGGSGSMADGGNGGGGGNNNGNGGWPFIRQGAVGYQPVIVVLPEGASMSTQAVISADRRYVRITIPPMGLLFSQIAEVNVFNTTTGESGAGRGGTGGQGFSGMGGGGMGGMGGQGMGGGGMGGGGFGGGGGGGF